MVKSVKNPQPLGLNDPNQWASKPTRKENATNITIEIGKTKILGIFMISVSDKYSSQHQTTFELFPHVSLIVLDNPDFSTCCGVMNVFVRYLMLFKLFLDLSIHCNYDTIKGSDVRYIVLKNV